MDRLSGERMSRRGPIGKNSGDVHGTAKPRALSLDEYSFNFTISTGERLRAYGGPPAHVLRMRRMEEEQEYYFNALQERYDALWRAAAAGSIDEAGCERIGPIRGVMLTLLR